MAKLTLLEIVQDILSDMSSDNVNTINDTDEALQVAQIVKSTYFAMLSNRNWPHTRRIVHLIASTDNLLPTHMRVQENIKEMISIFYNKQKQGESRLRYEPIKWMEPDDFLRYTNRRNSDSDNIDIVLDPSGVQILIATNNAPTYYTSFDDENLVFDSYDSVVDSTLQASKTQARAYVIPDFVIEDSHIPDLPEEAFAALVEEAKSKCMSRLKQQDDLKAEQESGRQQRWLSRKAWTVAGGIKYPNYGRGRYRGFTDKDITFRNQN